MLGEADELLAQQNLTLKPVQDLAEEFHIRLTNLAIEVSLFIALFLVSYNLKQTNFNS